MPTKGDKNTDPESSSLAGVLEMLQEQTRAMQEQHQTQQRMLLDMIEQQRVAHQREMKSLKESNGREEMEEKVKLPKPTLQKLTPTDNVEHFLATFERIAVQQKWPKEVWATQVAGLLSGKAMAAYAALTLEDAPVYDKVKEVILRRYEINEETYRQRFRQDRKKGEESYREYADRLGDHFTRWVASQSIALEQLITLEQFLAGVPEDLRIWLRERKPTSLRQAATLADDYALARKTGQRTNSSRPILPSTSLANNAHQQENSDASDQGQSQRDRPLNNLNRNGRSQTNVRGDKKCFQCGKFGHLMYSCPEREGQAAKPVLSGTDLECNKVAWNKGSQKYLSRGTLNGKSVQMLIDTGCTKTMVSTNYLHSNCLDHVNTEEILCVHGDKVRYPTAGVRLRLGQWSRVARVVAAPGIPVPVLLRTDIYELTTSNPLMVTTRAQARRGCDVTGGTDDTIKETTPDLGTTTEDTLAEDVKNGECGKTTTEMEVVEQRREEVPTSAPRESNPLEANADDKAVASC